LELTDDILTSARATGQKPGAVYDEMVTGTGQVRPHWQRLMGRLSPLDPAALEDRRDEAVQLLRQHGASYSNYGDPHGAERPWPLDLLPLVIPAEEWRAIEAGVIQRARLLDALLADIYGAGQLVSSGLLPPALLHANPRYRHPCAGVLPPGATHLHLSAFDLCRGPDGIWRVLSDRTQAPSGAGYALENRSVVGRVLADCVGDGLALPLAPFFAQFRDSLHALLPADQAARVVLLTPGPYNETYFEHVYLARHLGITLVEGNDLTVRDRQVFLKTLSGLERVGVILRRLDDDFCDPLELLSASALGVAGLTEAARSGNVVIANALGSGVTEAAAFKPLLAELALKVLGETLVLPDVRSWWCGRAADLAYVLANLDSLVIKPAFSDGALQPVFAAQLSRAERDALAARIRARPLAYVAQERALLSTAPVWNGASLEPRAIVLRVFVAAIGESFVAMPGGLTRTAASENPVVSMQLGGGSKDSWVAVSATEADAGQRAGANVAALPLHIPRRPSGGELPSRVADGLFWVGRYAERADSVVRILRTLLVGVTDAVQPWRFRDAEPVLNLAAWLELIPVINHPQAFQPLALVQAALHDPAHSTGVVANFQRLINAARGVRDRLPSDCWRILMMLDQQPPQPAGRAPPVRLLLRLDELLMLGGALAGAITDSMTRDAGWRFVEIGRRLERSICLIGTMRGLAVPPGDAAAGAAADAAPIEERRLLAAILALTDPRGPGSDQSDRALDRLSLLRAVLANEADPRSLAFQLMELTEHLEMLPRPSDSLPSSRGLIDSAFHLVEASRHALPDTIANACQPRAPRGGPGDQGDPLRPAFARLDMLMPQISDLLTQAYFTHAVTRSA
jgi:uncharacterized circularly permuted ATP-grasp superfamily protein/uncharacterized alpha-E superfamily protein